jgi:hypothetical protein
LNTELLQVEGLSAGIGMPPPNSYGEHTVGASDLLVDTGRVPNTEGLGLEKARATRRCVDNLQLSLLLEFLRCQGHSNEPGVAGGDLGGWQHPRSAMLYSGS